MVVEELTEFLLRRDKTVVQEAVEETVQVVWLEQELQIKVLMGGRKTTPALVLVVVAQEALVLTELLELIMLLVVLAGREFHRQLQGRR